MSWTARSLASLLLLLALLAPASQARALAPFSHFTFCKQIWPTLAPRLSQTPAQRDALWPVFLAGAIAHDAGYYPGAPGGLAEAVHLIEPWQVTRGMLALAQTPGEWAFALGWTSHALLDLRAHRDLVNVFTGGPFSQTMLQHKRFEWGLDCWLLSRPQGGWLWDAPLNWQPGLGLWQRVMARVYGRQVPLAVLEQAMQAEQKEIRRLPYVFWLSGRLQRPDRWAGNALGWLLGHSARPLYVAWLQWRDKDLNVRAVLTARWPTPQDRQGLDKVLTLTRGDLKRALADAAWPRGSLDADPVCERGDCSEVKHARQWLDSLPALP